MSSFKSNENIHKKEAALIISLAIWSFDFVCEQ